MRDRYDFAAVGGGPDALAAAILLARSGRSVLVVGECGQPGGVAAHCEIAPGFEVPVAPETLPSFDPAVTADLGLAEYGAEFLAPDPVLTVVEPATGETFSLPRDPEAARLAVAGISAADAARFPEFVAELGAAAGFLRRLLEKPPLELDAGLPDALRAALAALGLGGRGIGALLQTLPMALRDTLDDRFESEPLKAALAGAPLTGTRLGPRAPGTAGLFLHFHAFGQPAPLGFLRPPKGGAGALGAALRESARAAGAHLDSDSGGVRRILTEPGGAEPGREGPAATGIELRDGRTVRCGGVLSDASPRSTLLEWVGARNLAPEFVHEVANLRYRGTAARIGFALSGLPRFADAPSGKMSGGSDGGADAAPDPRLGGVIQIGATLDHLERAADAAKYGEIAEAPLVFAFLPSVHASGLAPPGRHTLAATVQSAPYALRNGGWNAPDRSAEKHLVETTLRTLERAFPGFRDLVTAHRVLSPATLEAGFGLAEGSFHQGEPTLDQFYALRPVPGFARHRTPVRRLWLAGPGTAPYGGLHLVSGRNAARVAAADLRN